MSAFTHGFNHGFFHGMFNRMFGGFGMFNWGGWNSAPSFFTPSYNFGNFFNYQATMPMMPSLFSISAPNFTTMNQNITWQNFDYTMPNFSTSFDWGDTFVKSTPSKAVEKSDNEDKTPVKRTVKRRTTTTAANWTEMTDSEMRDVYGNYTRKITDLYTGSVETLDKELQRRGVLKGKGHVFMAAQKKYGISASVLAAICIQETGGKGTNATQRNNVANISKGSGWRSYGSVDECILDLARMLKESYVSEGLVSLYQVNAKYCPVQDKRGSAESQSGWAQKINQHVTSYFEKA